MLALVQRRQLRLVAAHDVGRIEAHIVGVGAHEAHFIGVAGQQVVASVLDRLDHVLADAQNLTDLREGFAALEAHVAADYNIIARWVSVDDKRVDTPNFSMLSRSFASCESILIA